MNRVLLILTVLAVSTVIAFGLAATAASAAPVDPPLPGPASTPSYDGTIPSDGRAAASVQPAETGGPDGFDWGDAGIGAAGALALTMIGIGSVVIVSRRHQLGRRRMTA